FHPTGLVVPGSLMTGALLEEGLRGAGGRLFNAAGERFMARHDPVRLERSTRDVVARASFLEIQEGRGSPEGGVWLDVSHLGAAESTVFGGIAGDVMADWVVGRERPRVSVREAEALTAAARAPLGRATRDEAAALRRELRDLMWEEAGLARTEAGLGRALARI